MTSDWTLTVLAWTAPYLTAALVAAATLLATSAAAWAKHIAGADGYMVVARPDPALRTAEDN